MNEQTKETIERRIVGAMTMSDELRDDERIGTVKVPTGFGHHDVQVRLVNLDTKYRVLLRLAWPYREQLAQMAAEAEPALAPCPICGQRQASVIVAHMHESRPIYCVQCHYCGTRGPVDDNQDDAATHWACRAEG